jgi:hypothetical protein
MRSLTVAVVAALIAGCVEVAPESDPGAIGEVPPPAPVSEPAKEQPARVEAPTWAPGQSWLWRLTSAYTSPREMLSIVAGADATNYHIGLASEAMAVESVWFHLPPAGLVSRTNLAWDAHDIPVDFIRFPLEDGARWVGNLEGDPIDVVAQSTDGVLFQLEGRYPSGGELAMRGTYDAGIGQFRTLELLHGSDRSPWAAIELVSRGGPPEPESALLESPAYEDPVFVPHADDVLLTHFSGNPQYWSGPVGFQVEAKTGVLLLGCLIRNQPGTLGLRFAAPNGDVASCDASPGAQGLTMAVGSLPASRGEWRIVPTVVGEGWVFTEVAAIAIEERPFG